LFGIFLFPNDGERQWLPIWERVFGWPLWHGEGDGFAHHVKSGVGDAVTLLRWPSIPSSLLSTRPSLILWTSGGKPRSCGPPAAWVCSDFISKENETKKKKKKKQKKKVQTV